MTTPHRLEILLPEGKLHDPTGKTNITYNTPWPLAFSKAGVTGKMRGAVLHTMDGGLESCITTFNAPGAQGSAHLGIGTIGVNDGRIHQFVPFGQGYETYHAYAANLEFYGIETEDQGDLEHQAHVHPISDKGLWAWAQCLEVLSRFAAFPCQVMHFHNGHGLGYHRQFDDWNLSHHTCPGATMTDNVRVDQRKVIVERAHLIRSPVVTPPPRQIDGTLVILPGGTARGVISRDAGKTWT